MPYDGQTPQVPPGFIATLFATGLANPRRLLVLPNGDVLVAEQSAGYLTLLRDDGDGPRQMDQSPCRGPQPALRPRLAGRQTPGRRPGRHLARAACRRRAARGPAAAAAAGRSVPPEQRKPVPGAYGAEMITKKGVFGIVQGHQNRHLAIDPKTGALFVGVGSSGNLGVEPEPKATIQRFDADGSNQTTYASGTRNADRARLPARRPVISGRWCRSVTGSATTCLPII